MSKTAEHFVRQVADAETDDNSGHGSDDIHLTDVARSGATYCLGTTSSTC